MFVAGYSNLKFKEHSSVSLKFNILKYELVNTAKRH